MRNPDRIIRILNKIEAVWLDNPDFRLGQILVNFAPPRLMNDIFYWEDEDLEKQLDAYIECKLYNKQFSKHFEEGDNK